MAPGQSASGLCTSCWLCRVAVAHCKGLPACGGALQVWGVRGMAPGCLADCYRAAWPPAAGAAAARGRARAGGPRLGGRRGGVTGGGDARLHLPVGRGHAQGAVPGEHAPCVFWL
jgi:hypothetical protein